MKKSVNKQKSHSSHNADKTKREQKKGAFDKFRPKDPWRDKPVDGSPRPAGKRTRKTADDDFRTGNSGKARPARDSFRSGIRKNSGPASDDFRGERKWHKTVVKSYHAEDKRKIGPQRDGDHSEAQNRTPFRALVCNEARVPYPNEGRGMSAEPLVHLTYENELSAKHRAFKRFLALNHMKLPVSDIFPSPLPRGYRTTTKRKVLSDKGSVFLVADAGKTPVYDSALEPETHRSIYRAAGKLLNERENSFLVKKINFVILRSDGNDVTLIWNLDELSGDIVRAANGIAEKIREENPRLTSAFIFFDPKRSKYYFENEHVESAPFRIKRLFGKKNLSLIIDDIRYTFSPTSFSQVNTGIAAKIIGFLKDEFSSGAERLVDLYCGYGLFSCALGSRFKEVIGADFSRDSIDDAIRNVQHVKNFPKARFLSRRIDEMSIESILPKAFATEFVILDPPRQGTEPGVIEALCDRKVLKVAHIFCGVDSLPDELLRWNRGGYRVEKVVPFDMFPGTPSIEVVVILVPGKIS
ncbi:MAG TPA: hypothetical protein VF857_09150 [Spirochaetota bacterium]